MRADMDEHGTLTVWPETAVESFALARWADDYFKLLDKSQDLHESKVVLNIQSNYQKKAGA